MGQGRQRFTSGNEKCPNTMVTRAQRTRTEITRVGGYTEIRFVAEIGSLRDHV